MKTVEAFIKDKDGNPIGNSKGLLWGNNAAWLCTECFELLVNRTGDMEFHVKCANVNCMAEYEIERKQNRKGSLHLGAATGVRKTQ